MADLDFELANGFVNHGPMACEALAASGCEDQIDGWSRWFVRMVATRVALPGANTTSSFDWQGALGDYGRLPEWVDHFDHLIADDGWPAVVEVWVPRLVPALATALFHGAIRTAHAVRAVDTVDSTARRAELARALGYWAARFRPGQPTRDVGEVEEIGAAVTEAAANGARHYLGDPTIFNLHGVTGAMAIHLLVGHITPEDGATALAQVRAEHASMHGGTDATGPPTRVDAWDEGLARAAAASRDAHQVKLVEACSRGFALTRDPVFATAADVVTGRG
jgi:hypothetical protein